MVAKAHPPRRYPHPLNDLDTLSGQLERGHALSAYCPRCDSWAMLDLTSMVTARLGERPLPITVCCRTCGGPPRYNNPGG